MLLLLFCIPLHASGQSGVSLKGLPKHYVETKAGYLFPINPGRQNYLAGSMGELRTTHFHSGIDVRTNEKTGMPILAAQDGYISHVSIYPFGYGNTLYITHENGETTLYAHLQKLKGALADSIRAQQYKLQSFSVEVDLKKDRWLVKRGDTIAYSGNSGSSGGPHLHFDIRGSKNEALNPLQFKFDEIVDNLPPVPVKIALQTLGMDSRINSRFGRFEFQLQKKGKQYVIDEPIFAKGRIGVEISAYDKMNGSPFKCGINYITMWSDTQKVFNQSIEKVNLIHTREILTVVNYKVLQQKKTFFNRLYIADGNHLPYYEGTKNKGYLFVSDKKIKVRIVLNDTYLNQSDVVFFIQPETTKNTPKLKPLNKTWEATTSENILVVRSKKNLTSHPAKGRVFYKDNAVVTEPTYSDAYQCVFLIDMQKNLPDSMAIGKEIIHFGMAMIPSGVPYTYRGKRMDIELRENTLYDTAFISTSYYKDMHDHEVFSIGENLYPLKKNMKISLRPEKQYMENARVYEVVNKKYNYKGGKWRANQITFLSKAFGNYTILEDDQPPVVTAVTVNSQQIQFNIQDKRSGIAAYQASINGEWLLMNYDPKTATIRSEPIDKKTPMKGLFHLEVVDRVGNKSIYKKEIL